MSFASLSSDAKMRCAISSVGFLGIAGAVVNPKESFITMDTAIKVCTVGYSVFTLQFLCIPDFFYSENFTKKPKDGFGHLFMRMFGYMGLVFLYTITKVPTLDAFKIMAATNAGMCFIGPQRGEICGHPNVAPKHIVPHVVCVGISLAMLAAAF